MGANPEPVLLSPQAQAVIAGYLDPETDNEQIMAADEVWGELRHVFPNVVYQRSLNDEGEVS